MPRLSPQSILWHGLTVFSRIVGLQPLAPAVAAPAAPPLRASPAPLAAAAPASTSCQWSYYPISGGQLQPEQLLYHDPFNTPIGEISTGNLVYTALANGLGGFQPLSSQQSYGSSGWADYRLFNDLIGDVNGDGRSDLVWWSRYQDAAGPASHNLVAVGVANASGAFLVHPAQDFAHDWNGDAFLADFNRDGRADLLWDWPFDNAGVNTYAAARSNGDGTFQNLGPGTVYTGPGTFLVPDGAAGGKMLGGLTLVSFFQDTISNALIVVSSAPPVEKLYLPLVKK